MPTPTDTVKIIFLFKENPFAWALMPELLSRVKGFCQKFDTDSNGEVLAEAIIAHFTTTNPSVLAVVAFNGRKMVGHLLASIDLYHDKKYATIIQYELDKPVDMGILQAALDRIGQWGKSHGAEQVQVLAQSDKLAKAFRRFYDFRQHRILMRRII